MGERELLMSLQRTRRWRASTLATAMLLAAITSALGAATVTAANNVVVHAYIGDCQFAGSNAGSNKTVKIAWRDSDDNLKSTHSVTSNGAGNFLTKCEPDEVIEKGDLLKTTIGTNVRQFTVPKLTVNADRYSDSVTGKTVPLSQVIVTVMTYGASFNSSTAIAHVSTPTSDDTGFFNAQSWDAPPDIRGWDDVYVDLVNVRGDTFSRYVAAEAVRVWIRQPFVQIVGNPGISSDLRLTRGPDELSYTTQHLPLSGQLATSFVDADGDGIRVAPGDEIGSNLSFDLSFVVPNVTAQISKTTDRAAVDCGVNANLGVAVVAHTRDYTRSQTRLGLTDLTGFYSANFAAYDLRSGDKVDVYCKLSAGDVVARTFTIQ